MEASRRFFLYKTHFILVALLAAGLILGRRLLRWCRRRRQAGGGGPLAALRECAASLRDAACPGFSSDPMAAKMAELETVRRMKRYRFAMKIGLPINVAFLLLETEWRYLFSSWGGPWPPLPDSVAATVVDQMALVFFLNSLLQEVFPQLWTPARQTCLQFVMLAFFIEWIYFINQSWGELDCLEYSAYVLCFRFSIAYWLHSPVLNAAFQTAYCIVACYLSPHTKVIGLELYGILGLLLSTFYHGQTSSHEIRATLESTTSRNFLSAMDVLLQSVCDVVVHLSSELRIDKPSPHLQTMLLRSSQASFVGSSILDLADEAELPRLEAFLRRESDTAAVLHSSLVDGNGTHVQVQLFHAKGFDIMRNETFHVVGVQESGEEARLPPLLAPGDAAAGVVMPTAGVVVPTAGVVMPMGGAAARSGCSTLSSRDSDANSTTVWVDHVCTGLPITASSIECQRLQRACAAEEKLLDWVDPEEKQGLKEKVALCHSAGPQKGQLSLLLPQGAGDVRRRIRLSVEIECEQRQSGQCLAKLKLKREKRGLPRPEAEGRRKPSSSPQARPRAVLDHGNCLVVALDVLDPRVKILDVHSNGRPPDIGARVGDGFLDFFEEPDTFLRMAMGTLLHTGAADRLCQLLQRQGTDLAECIQNFQSSDIGTFTLRQPRGTIPVFYVSQIAVIQFFTYDAGKGLCALVALGKAKVR